MGQGRAGAGKSRHAATHVVMGRIGAPWGVKGWVKVFSFTEPAGNLLDYRHFEIESGAQLVPVEFDELKPHGSGFVGHIRGCDVREASGAFTGRELWLAKSALPQIGEGYYWHQLEGLRVVNLQDEVLGTVHHMMETGANDVMVVRGDESSVDRQERLLPWVLGQVVREVDLDAGLVRVDWGSDY
jgi:16S rRNA processing protein RimM